MSKVDELRERVLQKWQRFKESLEPRHEIIWGLLGDAEGTVGVPGQSGKAYCRLFGIDSHLVRAWNAAVPLVVNLRVDVEVERQEGMPDDYIVLGVGKVGYSGYVDETRNYVAPHHETHEYTPGVGGYDIVNVYNRALAELRADAQATPDMTVRISAGLYLTEDTMVVRGTADSPAFDAAPGAGLVRYDLLYLDTADNQYKITKGIAAVPAIATKPLPTDGQISIAWVLFEAGDTAITYTMITDARILYLPIGALGVGDHVLLSAPHTDTLVAAVVDGDTLIGDNTPNWSRLAIAVPAANVRNIFGVDNGEARPSWKTALDAVNPADIANAAAPGTALPFPHRDHVHKHPAGLGANLHHNEAHVVDSTGPHTGAGLTIGHVLRASGAGAFAFAELQQGDIGGDPNDPAAIHDDVAGEIVAIAEKAAPVDADVFIIEDSEDGDAKKRLQMVNLPGGADPNAVHVNVAAEIIAIAEKGAPIGADVLVIEDTEAANAKKRIQIGNLPTGADADAIHDNVAAEISAIAEKAVPIDADMLVIEDSAAGDAKKMVQIGNLPGAQPADFTHWDPDAPPAAPSALDDEFDDSAFDAVLWTEFDPANDLTLAEVEEGLRFDQITDPGIDWSGIYQAIPGGDFTITALLHFRSIPADYSNFALLLWEDATNVAGDLYSFGLTVNAANPLAIDIQRWTDYQTWAATVVATGTHAPHVYVRIRRATATYTFEYSFDGMGWMVLHSGALTFVPGHFGIGINNIGTGITIRGVAGFFRYKNSDISFIGSLEGDRVDGWRA